MLSIFSELGRTEEFFSEVIYPVWPLWLIGALLVVGAASFFAYRRGWHRTAAAHPLMTSAIAAVLIVVAIYPAYYTISPLFERNTVCEASPIPGASAGSDKCEGVAFAATMPPTASPAQAPAATASATSAPTSVPQSSDAATPAPTDAAQPTEAPAPTPFAAHAVRAGTWESADDFHFTIGDALLIESAPGVFTLRVENFSVRNGPDVYVLLSKSNDYDNGEPLNLGGLKGTDGAFNYEVPAGTDVTQYKSAIIWCKQFDVLFGHAELT